MKRHRAQRQAASIEGTQGAGYGSRGVLRCGGVVMSGLSYFETRS
jgi:hypothetical protein